MAATLSGHATALLRRTALLAGLLAIIGMHMMAGAGSMPDAATAPGTGVVQVAPTSATVRPAPGATAAHGTRAARGTTSISVRSCTDPAGCATMSALGAACIPAPGNPPLAAPLPAVTSFVLSRPATSPAYLATSAYLPGSPSPGELCISRT